MLLGINTLVSYGLNFIEFYFFKNTSIFINDMSDMTYITNVFSMHAC